jgi:hypothetical protein
MIARVLLILGACVLAGCATRPGLGYEWDTGHDDDFRTVAVPVFENHSYEVGLEAELTEAIIKEIQRSTNWSVTYESNAETVLTGVINSAEMRVLSQSRRTGLVEEMLYTVSVDFEWRDRSEGEPLVRRRGFTASGSFVPAQPSTERVDIARYGAVEAVARDLVAELRTNW